MKNSNLNKIIFIIAIIAIGFVVARELDNNTKEEKKRREREKIGLPLLDIVIQKERYAGQIKSIIKTTGYERVKLKNGIMTFQTIRDKNNTYDEFTFDLLGVSINYDDDTKEIVIDCDDSQCIQIRNQNYSTVFDTNHKEELRLTGSESTYTRFKELVEGYQDLKEAERDAKLFQ